MAVDNHFIVRKKDPEGEFYRKFARTQARYIVTADGTSLAKKTWASSPYLNRLMKQALKKFKSMPRTKVTIADRDVKPSDPPPPEEALILKVTSRMLKNHEVLARPNSEQPAYDRVWLTKGEWQALLPPNGAVKYDVPTKLLKKLARYHLIDIIGLERPPWPVKSVRACHMRAELLASDARFADVKLTGTFKIDGPQSPAGAGDKRDMIVQMDLKVEGGLRFDVAQQRVTKFILAVQGPYVRNGKQGQIGFHFDLAGSDTASGVPPWAVARYASWAQDATKAPYYTDLAPRPIRIVRKSR